MGPNCASGEWRPTGLKFHEGNLYLGGVCDASGSLDQADLSAYIYKLVGGTFVEVLSFPLDYPKGDVNLASGTGLGEWQAWNDDFAQFDRGGPGDTEIQHPQPMLMDLEFDIDGSLIMGFTDRAGHQIGNGNLSPDSTDNTLYLNNSGGDILRAAANGAGGFVIENNGMVGGLNGAQNNEGPGGGEFYSGDNFFLNGVTLTHAETSVGGLVLLPGKNEVLVSVYDPLDEGPENFDSGGVIRLSNTDGTKTGARRIYTRADAGTFGKGAGIGDLEITCAVAPIRLGNYVWIDTDEDGVQDPCEVPVDRVVISLYNKDSAMWEGVQTTANGGQYYFEDVTPNTNYAIVFGYDYTSTATEGLWSPSDNGIFANGRFFEITTTEAAPSTNGPDASELNDSDASLMDMAGLTQYPIIAYTTADTTDYNQDLGLVPGLDYGDLPNTYTTEDPDAPKHIVTENLLLGTCVDAENDGQSEAMAGLMTAGDDGTNGPALGACITPGDDEDGIQFVTPMIPGEIACIEVTAVNNTGNPASLQMWVDWNGDGDFVGDANEEINFTSGNTIPNSGVTAQSYCFEVPVDAVFREGAAYVRFRLSPAGGLAADSQTGIPPLGEIEDYKLPVVKVGQYTWLDNDLRGDQDFTDGPNVGVHAQDTGVNDVVFILSWYGLDNVLGTADDRHYIDSSNTGTQQGDMEDGIYYFCGLVEGTYQITPLRYADSSLLKIDTVYSADSTVYDIRNANTVIVDGTPIPRFNLAPDRKILTIANNIADTLQDSNGDPVYRFTIPDLMQSGLLLGENGQADVPTVLNYPDSLTDLSMDFGWVQEPNVELLQRIVGVDYPESGECGNFNLIVDLCMVNTAGHTMNYEMGVPLEGLMASANLADAFGDAFVGVVSTQLIGAGADTAGVVADIDSLEYDTTPLAPQAYPTLNPAYDGDFDTTLFFNSGVLWPGEKVMVRYVFEVAPERVPMMDGTNLTWNVLGSGDAMNYQSQPIRDYFNGGGIYVAQDSSSDYTNMMGVALDGTFMDPNTSTNIGDYWKRASQFSSFDQINFTTNAGHFRLV
ncbi:MAG: SdrD B-like domain-containing protein, partial [Bacteroidota bacterium]